MQRNRTWLLAMSIIALGAMPVAAQVGVPSQAGYDVSYSSYFPSGAQHVPGQYSSYYPSGDQLQSVGETPYQSILDGGTGYGEPARLMPTPDQVHRLPEADYASNEAVEEGPLAGSLVDPAVIGRQRRCQCSPRYFDFAVEALYLNRDRSTRDLDFAAFLVDGDRVLSTNDLDLEGALGFRVTGRVQMWAGTNLEATYFGTHHWEDAATVRDPGNRLYSPFSEFGLNPAGVGFQDTDQANLMSISYSSELNNVEMNYRRHFSFFRSCIQGSWLAGPRFLSLDERFTYLTRVAPHIDPFLMPPALRPAGEMNYIVKTTNNLLGAQIGGDIFACVLPGLSLGAEGKVGAYNNNASQRTLIQATTLSSDLFEGDNTDEVALIAEANFTAVWEVTESLRLRGGAQILFIDGLALAPENFNSTPPFVAPAPPRTDIDINANGNALFYGLTGGIEWWW